MPPSENGETPKYDLPPPIYEAGDESSNSKAEKPTISPEVAQTPAAPKPSNSKTQSATLQLNDFTVDEPQSVVAATAVSGNPAVADDNDLIEKEWVAKAKEIIENNREDPYNQSKEITLFKADYMKKRYNKVIKVSD